MAAPNDTTGVGIGGDDFAALLPSTVDLAGSTTVSSEENTLLALSDLLGERICCCVCCSNSCGGLLLSIFIDEPDASAASGGVGP